MPELDNRAECADCGREVPDIWDTATEDEDGAEVFACPDCGGDVFRKEQDPANWTFAEQVSPEDVRKSRMVARSAIDPAKVVPFTVTRPRDGVATLKWDKAPGDADGQQVVADAAAAYIVFLRAFEHREVEVA